MVTATLYQISPLMWSLFYLMYEAFERDGYDFFTGLLYYSNIHPSPYLRGSCESSNQDKVIAKLVHKKV